jgi:hypothetical protein
MNKTMVKYILAGLVGSVGSFSCLASALDSYDVAKFDAGPTLEETGHVLLSNPLGLYRYGVIHDGRMRSKPFVIGSAPRDDYQLFSWQEEEALWYVLQEQLDQNEKTEPKKTRKIRAAFKDRIDWPRVVLKGPSSVCVPEVPKANQDDWRDHLLCTSVQGSLE